MKRPPLVRLFDDEAFIDGFAGGGGASTGIEMALGYSPDVAINHDREALAMHMANHPKTRHIRSNIKTVNFKRVMRGKPVGGAWFSPDCTYHSKARGGKPFRDRNKARRIRGLAWEMVRCAIQVRPRVLFMENVEEIEFWGPLDAKGRPVPEKRGSSWRRFVARLRNLGYVCEWRRLRAKGHGAPTTRTRLFFIARCDGQPIVWPKETHGPGLKPYRTAAECLDFTLPVPSIFLTKRQAKAWGKAHGMPAPKRPLVVSTKRRIARGIMRFVVNSPEPFIIRFNTERGGELRAQFVNSMSDLFQDGVPDEYIAEVWKTMATIRRHTYQVLTKRPERMHALMPRLVATFGMLPNVWLGVSVENQRFLERIDQLKDTPAAVHFVSFEPLLDDLGALILDGIEWAIVGGESGPCARPCAMEWISSVVDECRVNKVPCFVKQLGAYVVSEGRTCDPQMCRFPERALLAPNGEAWAWRAELKHPKGGNPDEWPADLRVREFPKVCQ